MKVVLISMPDVVPILIHEMAIHMPGHGIACVGGNIDSAHEVYLIDLVRKRRHLDRYLTRTLSRLKPDLLGFSAMTWQYDTCLKLIRLVNRLLPRAKIAIGGYHATLMYAEIADSSEARNIDFIVRGEGEEAFRRLVNALAGEDRLEEIASLSFKKNGRFVHNPQGAPLDLTKLKLPIRDHRRLTWGYHFLYSKIELLETSRGCTRSCTFCSMAQMYGRTFRAYPIQRVLADLDDIYYRRKTRWVFLIDDNMVLDPQRVIALCDAIIARRYRHLKLVVQADSISMAQNEEMVRKLAQAGLKSVFLGIENVSRQNLATAHKGNIVGASQQAVAICHRHGIMVIGGLIFGFPHDDEQAIIDNYRFLATVGADAAYCQILTPYPKTEMRRELMAQGLVTNPLDYSLYSGLWANVRTQHLSADLLHYLFWYHRQTVLGWWNPSPRLRDSNWGMAAIWTYAFKPLMKRYYDRILKKQGWRGRYQRETDRLARMNRFPDLDEQGPS
jgi:anaerobic magnesium-protoporphyrin IX monomethyl ester cyclase